MLQFMLIFHLASIYDMKGHMASNMFLNAALIY